MFLPQKTSPRRPKRPAPPRQPWLALLARPMVIAMMIAMAIGVVIAAVASHAAAEEPKPLEKARAAESAFLRISKNPDGDLQSLDTSVVRYAPPRDRGPANTMTVDLVAAVHIGSKAVIGRHRKRPFRLGEYLCGYGLDCKVGVAVLLDVLDRLGGVTPSRDVYALFSAAEETGVQGAAWGVHQLPLETLIALEVGPVAPEYQIENGDDPVVLYRDAAALYSEPVNAEKVNGSVSRGTRLWIR